MDSALTTGIVVGGVLIVVAIGLAVTMVLWERSATARARRAALEAFSPFAQRFGVSVAHASGDTLPWIDLAGPHGSSLTIRADLPSRDAPMNDEPGAWLRKTLVLLAWIFGGILVLGFFALMDGAGSSSTSTSSGTHSGGGVRCTTLTIPLPRYFGALALKAKHGVWNRLWSAIVGSWPIGDPAFDSAFWIKAPPGHARAALTPPVRAALLAFHAEHGTFVVEGGRLMWSRRTYATAGLERVIDAMGRLTAALG